MRRLTIYLKYVPCENGKIKNTLSYIVRNDNEMRDCLGLHDDTNIKKYQLSNVR